MNTTPFCYRFRVVASFAMALTLAASLNCQLPVSKGDQNPWTAAESVEPARLAAELASASSGSKPTILYIGFRPLFEGAHITGATFHGAASTAQGLVDLKKWASTLPRATHLVIYCGCCPFGYCPNIRPAFVALHAMGFTHLRVLVMPNNFASDWVEKGYPVEKGS
jgi:thiosulfate/3-mercaptopyruvate sulfurtransferase